MREVCLQVWRKIRAVLPFSDFSPKILFLDLESWLQYLERNWENILRKTFVHLFWGKDIFSQIFRFSSLTFQTKKNLFFRKSENFEFSLPLSLSKMLLVCLSNTWFRAAQPIIVKTSGSMTDWSLWDPTHLTSSASIGVSLFLTPPSHFFHSLMASVSMAWPIRRFWRWWRGRARPLFCLWSGRNLEC